MSHTACKLLSVALGLALSVGCAGRIDRFTLDRVVPKATDLPDTGKVCALGEALAHPLTSLSKNEPDKAMVIAEGVSALCLEADAWEAELDAARAKANFTALGAPVAAEITDAALRAERAHGQASMRFELSFAHAEAAFGEIGEGECPRIKSKDEFAYLFGLISGTLSLIHDRKAGGVNGVPLDRLLAVARGADCIDSAAWWQVPSAVQAGAWATIPGSEPEGVDPWARLDEAAAAGETSGVRVGRAMQVLIAANAGAEDRVAEALRAFAASLEETPQDTDWALLDAYGTEVALHESDLLWTAETGHRTPTLGELPSDEAPEAMDDPFGEGDPFGGGDLFGGDDETDDEPADEGSESPDDESAEGETPDAAPTTDDSEETP